jgi:hypothetical protein
VLGVAASTGQFFSAAGYFNSAAGDGIFKGQTAGANRILLGTGSAAPTMIVDQPSVGVSIDSNLGIGTSNIGGAGEAALSIMNGNVGIGTWVPAYSLDLVNGTERSRWLPRVSSVTQSATPAINSDMMDIASITGLAQAITSMSTSLTGSPQNGQMLEVQITDNGTSQGITWGASFTSSTVTLPTATVISTLLHVFLQYDSGSSKWICVGVA